MSENSEKIKTIRAYYKLCQKPEHRNIVLKDKTFSALLPSLLKDESSDVIRYTVKMLVLLTEQTEDTQLLLKSPTLLECLTEACETVLNPSVNYNLMLVSSRMRAVKNSVESKRKLEKTESQAMIEPLANAVKELDKGGTVHRKFVGRKSKQITMEFDADEFGETKKREVERVLLKKKGVISVYITENEPSKPPRAVLRLVPTIDAKEVAAAIFQAGFEYVAQIVKVDGREEKFEMYAENMGKNDAGNLPDYLDEEQLAVDPASCVMTNEMMAASAGNGQNGWFSSITSFVKTSLW